MGGMLGVKEPYLKDLVCALYCNSFNPINYGPDGSKTRNAITRPIFIQFQQKSYGACPTMWGKPHTIFFEIR